MNLFSTLNMHFPHDETQYSIIIVLNWSPIQILIKPIPTYPQDGGYRFSIHEEDFNNVFYFAQFCFDHLNTSFVALFLALEHSQGIICSLSTPWLKLA